MKNQIVHEQKLSGLEQPQARRLAQYANFLSKDRSVKVFDAKVAELLMRYSIKKDDTALVMRQLQALDYSSSVYEAAQIESQIKRFQESNVPKFTWNKHFKKAKEMIMKDCRHFKLSVLNFRGDKDIADSLPRKDTHAGFSYILTGLKKKGEYLEGVFTEYKTRESEALQKGSFNSPILIGSRTQASTPYSSTGEFLNHYKAKTRLVSMYDVYSIIAELQFSKPVQSRLALVPWYAGGKNDNAINQNITKLRRKFRNWISLDYSGFDQSISDWLIREAFDIVRCMFVERGFNEQLFKVIVDDFIHKSFIDGTGKLRHSNKGVPSGSMFTQLIDSIVNRLMIVTYMNSVDRPHYHYDMMIMGDDNLIYYDGDLNPLKLESYLAKNFGVTVNAAKSGSGSSSQNPEFLSREWTPQGGYRNWKTLFAKMIYPERWRDYSEGKAQPELILYSYILAYPTGMRENFDLALFRQEFPDLNKQLSEFGAQGLSGYLAYQMNYNRVGLVA